MYFDALTTAAVADECRQKVGGGRVQQVVQVGERTVGFEVYAHQKRLTLIASAHAQHSRACLSGVKPRRGVDTPSPLLLLLRKYVRGGRIVAVRHPPFERILHLEIEGAEGAVTLTVEAMGRHANVILVGADGVVMDALKRVGPHLSRVRPILPGDLYSPPPPQQKLDPADVTELRLRKMLADADAGRPVWRALVNGIRGVSPLLGREIVYRAVGTTQARVAEVERISPLLDAFQGLITRVWDHEWQPCVALEEGRAVAYAPYSLTHYAEWEAVDTISGAIDRYYAALTEADPYASARANVRAALDQARKRVAGKRRALEGQLIPQGEVDRLRCCGEMILAYAHSVGSGQEELRAQVDFDGPPLEIELDPDLTAVENAQAYFARYEKSKAAAAEIPGLLARADLERGYLDQLSVDLELASNRPEIDEVKSALAEAGYITVSRGPKAQRGQPLRIVSGDGMVIWVGRSARQNHEVTFRRATPDDLWLHAVDVPGAHVVVKSGGQPVPEEVLRRAASLAAYYSASREERDVLVAYTPRRYVRPIRHAGPGMVTYRNERTIRVSPEKE